MFVKTRAAKVDNKKGPMHGGRRGRLSHHYLEQKEVMFFLRGRSEFL